MTASAPVEYFAFGRGGPVAGLVLAFAVGAGALSGAVICSAWSFLGRTLLALGALANLANPFRLVFLALVLASAAGVTALVGTLRTTAALGVVLTALCLWCAPLHFFLERRPLGKTRRVQVLGFTLLALQLCSFVAYERILPSDEIGAHGNPIVYREAGDAQVIQVTAGQDAFEMWIDGRLTLSTIDERRYFEALVQPAAFVAASRRRVLVLGGGTGLIERELLRHDDVEAISVVVLDRRVVDLSRRMSWLEKRSLGSLGSPKVHIIEAEPSVWLDETTDTFDLAIVDLPDPLSFVEGKNYSRWFYTALLGHLTKDGVVAIQATSAFLTPRTFANIRKTVEAAGFATLAYHAPIPTLGDWGFVLGFRGRAPDPGSLAQSLPFLSGVSPTELETLPLDTRTRESSEPSTLSDQKAVELFAEELPAN